MDYFKRRRLRRWTNLAFWSIHFPLYLLKRVGLISEGDFRKSWGGHLGWYFRGYTEQQASEIWDCLIKEQLNTCWRADVRAVLAEHRAAGDLVVLVSGGPVPLLKRIAQEVGAEHVVGTRFALRDGRYSGRSLPPVCVDENKEELAKAYLQQHGLLVDLQASFAYADSISDLHLLEMVGHPVATYPEVPLQELAKERGWKVFPRE